MHIKIMVIFYLQIPINRIPKIKINTFKFNDKLKACNYLYILRLSSI